MVHLSSEQRQYERERKETPRRPDELLEALRMPDELLRA
jgi:hypothetical protein